MKVSVFLCTLIVGISILTSGCSSSKEAIAVIPENTKEAIAVDPEKMKVEIEIINKSELPEGNGYTLKLTNTSPYLIKQNSVYLSYPIKNGSSSSWNKCKIEATGNKLDIKPNEEVNLTIFVDSVNFKNNNQLDIENPEIEFQCYINEVTENTHYQQIGDLTSP